MTTETRDDLGDDLEITKITRQAAGSGTWVRGRIDGHRFDALVFPEHAEQSSFEIGRHPDQQDLDRTDFGWHDGLQLRPGLGCTTHKRSRPTDSGFSRRRVGGTTSSSECRSASPGRAILKSQRRPQTDQPLEFRILQRLRPEHLNCTGICSGRSKNCRFLLNIRRRFKSSIDSSCSWRAST